MEEIGKLREQARFCRAQARLPVLPGAAAAFEAMAGKFEADAKELERGNAVQAPTDLPRPQASRFSH